MGEEELEAGHHHGSAAQVQELELSHGDLALGEGGEAGHVGAEDRLVHCGSGQPQT